MFPFKDRMPNSVKSFIVYKLQSDACDASYIGKLYQRLAQRNEKDQAGAEEHAFKEHTRIMGKTTNSKWMIFKFWLLNLMPTNF